MSALPEDDLIQTQPPQLGAVVLGWAIGSALFFAVRLLGNALLPDHCQGHTVLSLALPLLLGPGGLAWTTRHWRHPGRAGLGLGLMLASFAPALLFGVRDIGQLRSSGCAGGYLVVAPAGERSVSEVVIRQGGGQQLTLRLGGFAPEQGNFDLSVQNPSPDVQVQLPRQIRPTQTVTVGLSVNPKTPINTYSLTFAARQGHQIASSTLSVNVRPALP